MTKIGGCGDDRANPPAVTVEYTPVTVWRDFYGSDTHTKAGNVTFGPEPWAVSQQFSERLVTMPAARKNVFGVPMGTPGPFVTNIRLATDDFIATSQAISRNTYTIGGFWKYNVGFHWEDPRADEIHPVTSNPFFPNPLAGYMTVEVLGDGASLMTETFLFGYRRAYYLERDYDLVDGEVVFTPEETRDAAEPVVGYYEGDQFSSPAAPSTLDRYMFLRMFSGFSEAGGGYAGNRFHFTGREIQFKLTVRYSKSSRPRFTFRAEKLAGFC